MEQFENDSEDMSKVGFGSRKAYECNFKMKLEVDGRFFSK